MDLYTVCIHDHPLALWVSSWYSSFLQQSRNMSDRLMDSRSSFEHASLCLSGLLIAWRPEQGIPILSLRDRFNRLQHHYDPE